ncbi:MAG: recombinase family protein, partial [Streptosporangiaceae bacterium]
MTKQPSLLKPFNTAGHVAIYCRISSDPTGRGDKIEDQEKWGREYAAETWPGVPVVVYADNNLSAHREGLELPGLDRLCAAIKAGQVLNLWAKEQSRLARLTTGDTSWFAFAALCSAHGLTKIHTKREGLVDVGGVLADLKAVLSHHEVKQMTERINDRLDKIAEAGKPPGATPFGYRHGRDGRGDKTYVIVPEQADAIRWCAGKVLAGWALGNIAAALRDGTWTDPPIPLAGPHRVKVKDGVGQIVRDALGDPVTRPSVLSASSVRNMVTLPTVAGKRVHRGQIIGAGNWEPILSEDTWQACRARLSAPRMVERGDSGTYPVGPAHTGFSGRVYTLTGGLARCGVCGSALVGAKKQLRGAKVPLRTVPYLLCRPTDDGGKYLKGRGGHVGIMLEETEQFVVDELFRELDRPEVMAMVAADDHAERRAEILTALDGVEGQRAELAAMWAAGDLTAAEWKAARTGLDAT